MDVYGCECDCIFECVGVFEIRWGIIGDDFDGGARERSRFFRAIRVYVCGIGGENDV